MLAVAFGSAKLYSQMYSFASSNLQWVSLMPFKTSSNLQHYVYQPSYLISISIPHVGFKTVPETIVNTVEVGSSLNFVVSVESGSDVMKYRMDYGAGAGATDYNATSFLTNTFLTPGERTVTGYAWDDAEIVTVSRNL